MAQIELLNIRLDLFDGAAAGGEGAGAAGADAAQGETNSAVPSTTRRGKSTGEYANVVFGKQDAASQDATQENASAAGEQTGKKSFDELINGEYKEDFAKAFQDKFDRRFKDYKNLESRNKELQRLADVVDSKYQKSGNITDLIEALESDSDMWEKAADEAGLSVDQFKMLNKLQRENSVMKQQREEAQRVQQANAQYAAWEAEAEKLKPMLPNFDLKTEVQNPAFLGLISNRQFPVSLEAAYRAIHGQELMQQAVAQTQQSTEAAVTANIRAKGMRPSENGTQAQSAFMVKDDVSKLTRKDRKEAVRRAALGETIRF